VKSYIILKTKIASEEDDAASMTLIRGRKIRISKVNVFNANIKHKAIYPSSESSLSLFKFNLSITNKI
jgi:hypothetical protein